MLRRSPDAPSRRLSARSGSADRFSAMRSWPWRYSRLRRRISDTGPKCSALPTRNWSNCRLSSDLAMRWITASLPRRRPAEADGHRSRCRIGQFALQQLLLHDVDVVAEHAIPLVVQARRRLGPPFRMEQDLKQAVLPAFELL